MTPSVTPNSQGNRSAPNGNLRIRLYGNAILLSTLHSFPDELIVAGSLLWLRRPPAFTPVISIGKCIMLAALLQSIQQGAAAHADNRSSARENRV